MTKVQNQVRTLHELPPFFVANGKLIYSDGPSDRMTLVAIFVNPEGEQLVDEWIQARYLPEFQDGVQHDPTLASLRLNRPGALESLLAAHWTNLVRLIRSSSP